MKVTVEYAAQLKRAAGIGSETIEVSPGCTLAQLIDEVARRHNGELNRLLTDESGALHPSILLFVGDEQVRGPLDRELRDRDVVTMISPISGG